ncbi:uncharacterized protein N7459_005799 [Penicillium hispanicum]|uniref:uncharacterized protein n=1 Tax=Penicillium hispanicum TaxID=1080232 RepID=UPI0025425F99|nr:uncharacterized protein N7459_005799 [Penicillium hispanicum]KAJ5579814.1 hypothetical protein N7459_005799 [Penicillium hispanicum]
MVEMLGPLPARPPTPPRRGSRIDQGHTESPIPVQTPGDSSYIANSPGAPPSSRGSKRVTFSPWLQSTVNAQPSKKDSPYKSILKETNSPIPVWSPNVDTFTSESLAMLLESVIQQLAGESITARLDAYMQFFGALRTYEGLPAGQDIAEKLGLITDFIQRDVNRDLVNGAPIDTNLVNQALKLSAAFIWNAEVSAHLSEEFKIFLVDHAITSIHEAKVPKSVLTHYMSILSTQNFGPRVMTSARVTRLLTVLHETAKQTSGKAIAVHRVSIYHQILTQSKSTFLTHASLWVEHLISGLLNHVKEVRVKSITLGFQISVAAAPNQLLSKSIRDLFDRPLENDRKMVTEIRERMSRMMAPPDSGVHVPQIWSVIVLLLRSKKWKLYQWEHFKEWLLVLQKCLNCSEPAIKSQAILGWNRFVFAVGPDESTGQMMLKMLGKPVLSQFERRKYDKCGSSTAQLALGSYYNLLYYAFRPSPSHQHLDLIWEEYVALPCATVFSTLPVLSDSASRVLANLLWSPQPKIWTDNRISDTNRIEPQEIPSIDFRWVRSRVSEVMKVFESLFTSSIWNDSDLQNSNIALAWTSLSCAFSMASSKEITPSGESMHAVSSVLGVLHRLWAAGPSSLNAVGERCTDIFLERFRFLSTVMIVSFGGIFTDKIFLRTADGAFQTANTPTHRSSGPGTNMDSPILHLVRTIIIAPITTTVTTPYISLVDDLIEASCKSRISRGSRLELLQQFAVLGPPRPEHGAGSLSFSAISWKASARAAADALQSFPVESARERDGSVSRDYENVMKILTSGLHLSEVSQEWSLLLEAFMRVAKTEKGDQVLPGLIVEPISQGLMSLPVQQTYRSLASLLGHSLAIPFIPATGAGDGPNVARPVSSLLFPSQLLETTGRTLRLAYESFSTLEGDGLADFIESLTSFLGSGMPSFRSQVLQTLQSSLGFWVKDQHARFDAERGVDSRTLTACRALLSAILNILQISVIDEASELSKFETIICAGLESLHASRVKKFVDFWYSNATSLHPAADKSAIGQSLRTGLDTLQTSIALQDDQESKTTSSNVANTADSPLENPPVIDSIVSGAEDYPQLNSSPVIGTNDPLAPETADLPEPQLPMNSQPEPTEERMPDDASNIHNPENRREMFRMLESIRSSSPATTPGKFGFDTPLHLRRLHASNFISEIPLTPTLAPAENEDGFMGSSPTPATRDPTPAMNSDVPVLQSQDILMNDAPDIPSSPPELGSRSPSPQKRSKRSRRERRKSARAKRALARASAETQSLVNSPAPSHNGESAPDPATIARDDATENKTPAQLDERPPSRRTRSALSQSTDNDQNVAPPPTFKMSNKTSEDASSQDSKSISASKKKKKRGSKPLGIETPQPVEQVAESAAVGASEYIDSSSDDLETQIASQLEQDLESAADMSGQTNDAQLIDESRSSQASKKRKRVEDEVRPPSAKETRRSTRFSTTKESAAPDLDEPDVSQSQNGETTQASQYASLDNASSSVPRRTTRSSQRKELAFDNSLAQSPQLPEATQESTQGQEASQPPPKRSRKSLGADSEIASSTIKESNNQPKSTRSTRSRNKRSSQFGTQSRTSPAQNACPQHEIAQSEAGMPQDEVVREDIVPESIVAPEGLAQQDPPLVSTEEATDSQMTYIDTPADAISTNSDFQKNVHSDVDQTKESTDHSQQVTSVATIIQIEPSPAPALNTSESGITDSLKTLLGEMKLATLSPTALREVDDLLFSIRVEAHDASRRHNPSA